ncbi:MAG: glycosyltransferase [Candidatus Dormibacteria bacterium]
MTRRRRPLVILLAYKERLGIMPTPRYWVYVSDRGNIFMTEVAALLSAALADLSYETVFPAPGLPEREPGRINLVVAPHEFFPLQRDVGEAQLLRAAEASVTVGVEQPGTAWFDLGAHYSSVAAAVLDISPYAVAALRDRGIEATHIQLGYHPSWDRWSGESARERPTDFLFLGAVTQRRLKILSSMAPLLWDWTSDIRLFEFPRPMSEVRGSFLAGADKWDLLASSRILINIHRDDVPYFEWVRVLEAVVNGCLVITEASTDYGTLEPGKHLIAVPAETLPSYAVSVITDEVLRSEMASAAYDFVRSELLLTTLLEPICALLDGVAPRVTGGRKPLPTQSSVTLPPSPRLPALEDTLASEMRVRARVKELLDSETHLIRQTEALEARLRYGDPDHADTFVTGAWEGCTPEVSVVITSYNYQSFIVEAMESVVSSIGVSVELVVVDDHSEDASVSAIRGFMAANDWFPIMLVARAANVGLSEARNTGITRVRGDRIFMLDADNVIFPNTLVKLSVGLDGHPDAALAYGIIGTSDDGALLSHLPWDLARLCMDNYIDAMALIRRAALEELGGYDEYFGQKGGWEDYELWLRFGANGYTGVFLPEFVGWYRVHPMSLVHMVNLDTAGLVSELRRRYPFLPWPAGDGAAR